MIKIEEKRLKKELAKAIAYDQIKEEELRIRTGQASAYRFALLSIDDMPEICRVYQAYNGCQEFLHIPSREEISATLLSDNGAYLGMKTENGRVVGFAKVQQISGREPFFVLPVYEQEKDGKFFGFSGLIVDKDFRKKGIAKRLLQTTGRVVHRIGGMGLYADCDYRNVASFQTLSSVLDFIGFTDGRCGAKGEQTIYTTFYSSYKERVRQSENSLVLDFSSAKSLTDAVEILENKMVEFGGYSSHNIAYGDGFNMVYVLDENIKTAGNSKLILPQENSKKLVKDFLNVVGVGYSVSAWAMQQKEI